MFLFVEILPEPVGLFLVGIVLVGLAVGTRSVIAKYESAKNEKEPETPGR